MGVAEKSKQRIYPLGADATVLDSVSQCQYMVVIISKTIIRYYH